MYYHHRIGSSLNEVSIIARHAVTISSDFELLKTRTMQMVPTLDPFGIS